MQYGYGSSAAFRPDGTKFREFKGGGTNDHFDNFLEAVRTRDRSVLNADIEDGTTPAPCATSATSPT